MLRSELETALECDMADEIVCRKAAPITAQLWTTKYAPQNMKEICGNKAPVERLGQWLQDWCVLGKSTLGADGA